MEKKKFIIIGGGLTGLMAAFEAEKKGIETLVLEESLDVGGRLEYVVSFTTYRFQPRTFELLNELELDVILSPILPENLGFYSQKKVLPFSEFSKFVLSLPQDQQEKLNYLLGTAMQSNFDPENPSSNLLELREISFGEYLRNMGFSPQTIKMFVEPMLTFTFLETLNLDQISAEYGLFNIRFGMEMGQKDVFTFEEGIKILANILKRKIIELGGEVATECKVTKIQREKEGFVIWAENLGKEKEYKGEKVLLAFPLTSAPKIVPELEIPQGLSYCQTKVFILEGKLKFPQKYILGFPGNEANLRFIFAGPANFFYVYPYFLEKPVNFNDFFEEFSIKDEIKIESAFPIISPGTHLKNTKTNISGIFLAGDYYYYPFLDTCLFTAKKVVEEVEKELS